MSNDHIFHKRLKQVLELDLSNFYTAGELTERKGRDARIYRNLSKHLVHNLDVKTTRLAFRALIIDLFHTASSAVAQDAGSPTWATAQIAEGPKEDFFRRLRESLSWGVCVCQVSLLPALVLISPKSRP